MGSERGSNIYTMLNIIMRKYKVDNLLSTKRILTLGMKMILGNLGKEYGS